MMPTYDFAIIGGGPTGYAAAMYAGRLNLKTILFSGIPGGLIITTDVVENYPGFATISGFNIFQKIQNHARRYDIAEQAQFVVGIERTKESGFVLKTPKENYLAKTVLFATGAEYKKLPVPGSLEFENKGVHFCALCDGFSYKNKVVAVVGGSDSAAKEALELAQNAQLVYIIYRGGRIHPEPVNAKRVAENSKIVVINNTRVTKIVGDTHVRSVEVDKSFSGSGRIALDAVFVAIGQTPRSELAAKIGVQLNEKGEIMINRSAETNVPGAYAAGDVVDTEFKQMIVGCAEGVLAAYGAFNYIQLRGGNP